MPGPHDPLSAFQVGDLTHSGRVVTASQQLSARFADHRGRIDLPALGVLFDHVGGIPFHLVHADGAATMQARLSMSMQGHIDVDELLSCRAEVMTHDDRTGATVVEIRTGTGRVCCVGTARNVRVGRAPASTDTPRRGELDGAVPGDADSHGIVLPEAIPSGLSGREVVAQIATGTRSAGPLMDFLNARVELDESPAGPVIRLTAVTEPWMGNMFGTMHGGVIATIVGQAASLAGQAHAEAGRDHVVGDLAVGFFRSPPVQGEEVVVEVRPIKVGRRIASFDAEMTGQGGLVLSHATADIHFR